MIIHRYIEREVLTTLFALTTLLLLIFLSNQFVHYVGRAANGSFPGVVILQLMMLEIPNLLGLILPLGFYIALLLALGRLYADSEMMVFHAGGFSYKALVYVVLRLAFFVALFCGVLVLYLAPNVSTLRTTLIRQGGVDVLVKTLTAKQFRLLEGGKKVIYVEDLNSSKNKGNNIFIAQKKAGSGFEVIKANQAHINLPKDNTPSQLIFSDGAMYQGVPGEAAFKISRFSRYIFNIPPLNIDVKDDVRTLPTSELFKANNHQLRQKTELMWRLSIPLMTLVLALLSLPLAKVNPRQGKFAKLIPAILLYVLYANFMFIGRDWLADGVIPLWMGLWWLHASFILLALFLIYLQKRGG